MCGKVAALKMEGRVCLPRLPLGGGQDDCAVGVAVMRASIVAFDQLPHIAAAFPGWFAIISEDGHTAGYFNCLEQVAMAQVSHFLAREPLQGYRLLGHSHETGRAEYSRTVVLPGQVLGFLGVYEDVNIRATCVGMLRPAPAECRYAKCCHAATGDVVFVPLGSRGKFYSVARRSSRSPNHVFPLAQLLRFARVPLTVRLVCGPLMRTPTGFTGILRLEHVQEQEVVLACSLQEGRPTLLEIDMGSTFSFVPERDSRKMGKSSQLYNRMLRHCLEEADRWRSEIKVAHHVVPKHQLQVPGGRSVVLKKSTSSASKKSACSFVDLPPSSGVPTLKSQMSTSSKKSSTSSTSSNPFKKLWSLHRSASAKKASGPPKYASCDGSETADEFEKLGVFRTVGPNASTRLFASTTDHIYESIPRPRATRTPRYLMARDVLPFKASKDFEPAGDDGYGTSHMDSDSVYDSIS
ncbi:hypothetical protein HPB51_020922 [Rhipicephalus microplus]|uniref:CABIT domain-containing protein n=1 Tax=Rhipicephalus microplus TaxID=6941 RepID=A0A9J6EBW6_RHIMP|nr:hypothetical protein HPB51_020922 [Rhipicephalus microplus]